MPDKGLSKTKQQKTEKAPESKVSASVYSSPTAKDGSDLCVWGQSNMFKTLFQSSSQSEGWSRSTKALEIPNVGVVLQVTTQTRNSDGSYSVAEALTNVPGVKINEVKVDGKVQSRGLIHF